MSTEDGEVKIIVHLTVFDDAGSASGDYVTSDIEVWMTKEGCVAELKAILESQDLLPSSSDNGTVEESFVIEVRLTSSSTPLRDEDELPQGTKIVHVTVRHPTSVPQPPQPSPTPVSNLLSSLVPQSSFATPSQITSPAFPGLGGLPPSLFSGLMNMPQGSNFQETLAQNLMNDPQMMRQLMNTPIMRSMMSNPDILRSLMEANPQMRELRERNPELNHLLNDPELLRQSMEAMQNPSLMREMISNTDRALSNIDAIPGGFNALRRVYQTIQEPIWNAALRPDDQSTKKNQVKNYDLGTDKAPSTEAIPNPWAQGSTSSTSPFNQSTTRVASSHSRLQQHRSTPQLLTEPQSSSTSYPEYQPSPRSTSVINREIARQQSLTAPGEKSVSSTSARQADNSLPLTVEEKTTHVSASCRSSTEPKEKLVNNKAQQPDERPVKPEERPVRSEDVDTENESKLLSDSPVPPVETSTSMEDHSSSSEFAGHYPYLFQSFFTANPANSLSNHLRLRSMGSFGMSGTQHVASVPTHASDLLSSTPPSNTSGHSESSKEDDNKITDESEKKNDEK